MIQKLSSILLVTILIFAASCNKKITNADLEAVKADFGYDIELGIPAIVTFTNTSKNAEEFNWDFGDGGTSVETNPIHTYTVAGTYVVKLTALGEGGDDEMTQTITIHEAPVANFSFSIEGIAPARVIFNNTSKRAGSYLWDFGDGEISEEENPTHIYTQGGTYAVKLTAIGEGGEHSITKNLTVISPTVAKITTIKVISLPFTKLDGSEWDSNSGPDVFFRLTDENGEELLKGPVIQDATAADLPLTFNLNPTYQITNFTRTYGLELRDEDADSSEFIGSYHFDLSVAVDDGYATTLTLSGTESSIRMELTLTWQ